MSKLVKHSKITQINNEESMMETFKRRMEFYADKPKYDKLRDDLLDKARLEFEKSGIEDCDTFHLGIKSMPLGYYAVRRFRDWDGQEIDFQNEVYFWVDFKGNRSAEFTDKWEVYYDARDRSFDWSTFNKEEIEWIKKYDPLFNDKTRIKRIKNPVGVDVGWMRYPTGDKSIQKEEN